MELFLLREAAVIIACCFSAYTDLKTGEIPNKITYTLIAIGAVLNIVEQNWTGLALGAGIFAIGYALYYSGKIGGGDVKLFAGIAMAMPFIGGIVFILPVLLYSALVAVMFLSVYYFVKLARLKKLALKENMQGIVNAVGLGAILAAYFYFMTSIGFFQLQNALVLAIPLGFACLFLALEKSIRKNFFLKEVPVGKLEEDELIALEFLPEKIREKINPKAKRIIDEKMLKELKKMKITKILVYRNLPRFAPFILAGVILAILRPELVAGVFRLG